MNIRFRNFTMTDKLSQIARNIFVPQYASYHGESQRSIQQGKSTTEIFKFHVVSAQVISWSA